jgi:hypothetical protein
LSQGTANRELTLAGGAERRQTVTDTARHEARKATLTGAIAPTKPLNALDLCDRCGAQAYVRVLMPGGGELLFCAHHSREHSEKLAEVAIEIHDETGKLTNPAG